MSVTRNSGKAARRIKDESDILFGVWPADETADFERPFSPEQLEEKRRRLSLLSPQHVADAYKKAHEDCKMIGDRPPRAAAVQELVTVWRLLWKWRRN